MCFQWPSESVSTPQLSVFPMPPVNLPLCYSWHTQAVRCRSRRTWNLLFTALYGRATVNSALGRETPQSRSHPTYIPKSIALRWSTAQTNLLMCKTTHYCANQLTIAIAMSKTECRALISMIIMIIKREREALHALWHWSMFEKYRRTMISFYSLFPCQLSQCSHASHMTPSHPTPSSFFTSLQFFFHQPFSPYFLFGPIYITALCIQICTY